MSKNSMKRLILFLFIFLTVYHLSSEENTQSPLPDQEKNILFLFNIFSPLYGIYHVACEFPINEFSTISFGLKYADTKLILLKSYLDTEILYNSITMDADMCSIESLFQYNYLPDKKNTDGYYGFGFTYRFINLRDIDSVLHQINPFILYGHKQIINFIFYGLEIGVMYMYNFNDINVLQDYTELELKDIKALQLLINVFLGIAL